MAGEVENKGNVWQNVWQIIGPAVGAIVTVLIETLLESGGTSASAILNAWPALLLGVAAGVGVIGAARLLPFLGRKVRPWFRTRKGKLKALASEIRELRGFETPTGPDAQPLVSDYRLRCDELIAKLDNLGIQAPTREQFVIWRPYLTVLYDCAIRRNVEMAKGVLKELEPEIDVYRHAAAAAAAAAALKGLAPEIKELHDYKKANLATLSQAENLEVSHYLQRCHELRKGLYKLGISLPPRVRDTPSLTRWRAFLRKLYGCAIRGDVEMGKRVLGSLTADQNPAADGSKAESGAEPANPAL